MLLLVGAILAVVERFEDAAQHFDTVWSASEVDPHLSGISDRLVSDCCRISGFSSANDEAVRGRADV